MKSIILFLFFVGMILIIHGIYEQKYKELKDNVRVEYRFIPRSYYEEQLQSSTIGAQFKNMFDKESPWFDRTVSSSELPPKSS